MKYFKITDQFKFANREDGKKGRAEITEELKYLKTVFNKNQTMNLLFCQKKQACFICILLNVVIGFG